MNALYYYTPACRSRNKRHGENDFDVVRFVVHEGYNMSVRTTCAEGVFNFVFVQSFTARPALDCRPWDALAKTEKKTLEFT